MQTHEQAYFERIEQHIIRLKTYLADTPTPEAYDAEGWFEFIAQIRSIQGNINNDQSFLATYLAKEYLMQRFDLHPFDAAEKAQGAPGLDIDAYTISGERIIGEIKTTVPYGKNDLGANQKASFQKDFDKLNQNEAHHKFLFVTDRRAYDVILERYVSKINAVEVVLLR